MSRSTRQDRAMPAQQIQLEEELRNWLTASALRRRVGSGCSAR